MTTEGILSSHIYRRELPGIGPDDSLRRLADWIPADTTVLELGPATGYFTRYLSESLGCTVDAIELDTGMAEQVRPFCRKLIVGDLVDPDVLAALEPNRYRRCYRAPRESGFIDQALGEISRHGRHSLVVGTKRGLCWCHSRLVARTL